jgi:PAS domain S-box-containing protein
MPQPEEASSDELLAGADLRNRYDELQRRVTRFNVVEQELINTRNRLDRELERFGRIHAFNTRGLHAHDVAAFANIVAEAVVDIFELEFGALFLTDSPSQNLGNPASQVGLHLDEAGGRALDRWAQAQLAGIPRSQPIMLEGERILAVRDLVPARQLILASCHDASGVTTGLLVGGISETGAPFHDAIESGLLQSFQVFCQQVAALIDNRHGRATIEDQMKRIEMSEERLALALEGSNAGFWDWNIRTDQFFFSIQWTAMLGYGPGEIGASSDEWRNRIHPEDLKEVLADLEAHLAGETDHFEHIHRLRHRAGHYVWILTRGRALRDRDGRPYRMVGTHLDISPQKEMERRLREAEESQRLAREQAEAASQAKSVFLAGMSHEIRTPLYGVLGAIQLLRDYPLAPEQVELVEMAEQSATSLLSIIGDILDLSKVEAGRLDLESVPFCLPAAVREAVAAFELRAKAAKLALTISLPNSLPEGVLGDANRLRQILNNLVGNAIKFTHQGSISVSLEVSPGDHPPIWVEFSVRDTGIGIAPEVQSRLFNTFVQADSSTTRRYGGSGLGLAICRLLVELMGGRIWIVSQPGQGADFRFRIPFKPVVLQTTPPVTAKSRTAQEHLRFQGRVLVAEDNPISQRLAPTMLRKMGLTVDVASNGVETVALFQRGHYDVIFMDCHMPEMDGYEATRAIRQAEMARDPQSPRRTWIVALTANALAGERERCLAAGMDDYLNKPFTLARLRAVISRVFGCETFANAPLDEVLSTPSLFDAARLDQLCEEIDVSGVLDVVRDFLADLPERARQIQELLAAGNLAELRRLAHSLRGVSSSLGLDLLSRRFTEIEQTTIPGDSAIIVELVAGLSDPIRQSQSALHSWFQARNSSGPREGQDKAPEHETEPPPSIG